MTQSYDYIIVGGGPAGMTLAHILSKVDPDQRILLLEREKSLGGCHRVRRVEQQSGIREFQLFTEHGPRIYINNYHIFKQLMNDMGMEYNDYFTDYGFQFLNMGGNIIQHLKFWPEVIAFAWAYLRFMIYPGWSKHISMEDWMRKNGFSEKSFEYVDRICRLTDGAGADRYTLFEYLHLANQNTFYDVKQPKKPNDLALFGDWSKYLKKSCPNLEIRTESDVTRILSKAKGVLINKQEKIHGSKLILAIPPKHLVELLSRSKIFNAFGQWNQLVKWEKACRYLVYIPIIYHWIKVPGRETIKFENVWGLPEKSDWGVVFIVMSDYMDFSKSGSEVVITVAITKPEAISQLTGKTPHQSNREEILTETFRQMAEIFPQLAQQPPDYQVLSPGVFKNDVDMWETKDSAFMLTPDAKYLPNRQSTQYPNLYSVGTHNGKSTYHFTSLEAAVENAVDLAHHLAPQSKKLYRKPFRLEIRTIIIWVTIAIVLFYLWYLLY
jgi:protoporphyrinogen oxidase